MLFHADEHVRFSDARTMLTARGHELVQVRIADKDPAVLASAERDGAVILTADTWISTQLRRTGQVRSIYRRAGVVRIPGEWSTAMLLLRQWLPLIEVANDLMQQTADKRLVVEIRPSTILIDG